jgi:hypothetical protein
VSRDATLLTLFGAARAKREHVTTVTTPIGTNVGDGFETVRNLVVELIFIGFAVF